MKDEKQNAFCVFSLSLSPPESFSHARNLQVFETLFHLLFLFYFHFILERSFDPIKHFTIQAFMQHFGLLLYPFTTESAEKKP